MAASLDKHEAPMHAQGAALVAALLMPMMLAAETSTWGQEPTIVFKSSVELVSVNAVVRDRRGRPVQNLRAVDFEVIDGGQPRTIIEFRHDLAGVSVALLFDVSGSMEGRLGQARDTANFLLGALDAKDDEAAVFTFDTRLDEVAPFTTRLDRLPEGLAAIAPFGATSLHDAIAATAERFDDRGPRRRAVVVFTDGNDTASRLTPSEVSGIASAIDVPVYILAVVPTIDVPSDDTSDDQGVVRSRWVDLTDLARWTGGDVFFVTSATERSTAARQLIEELRHQYFMAFEAGVNPGWHPLVVRTRDRNLRVRARSGYFAGLSRPTLQGG